LPGNLCFEPGNDIVFENMKQPGINGSRDDKEGLAVHGIYPVISFGALTQTLTGDVMVGKRCSVSMIYPYMAVYVERPRTVRIGFHPFGA
jgi:hypothetical protein